MRMLKYQVGYIDNRCFPQIADTTRIKIKGDFGTDAKKIVFTDADKKIFTTYFGTEQKGPKNTPFSSVIFNRTSL